MTSSTNTSPTIIDSLSQLGGLKQVACAERCLLVLSKTGKVYCLNYNSDTQVSNGVKCIILQIIGLLVNYGISNTIVLEMS